MFSEAYRLKQLRFCSSSTMRTMILYPSGLSFCLKKVKCGRIWESLHKLQFHNLFPRRRGHFVKLIVAHVVKQFSKFHRTLSLITLDEKPTDFTLSWAILIQSTDFRPTYLISSLIPRSHERKSLLTGGFHSGFTTRNIYICFSNSSSACYISWLSYSFLFERQNVVLI
jgi:hypothetical protein